MNAPSISKDAAAKLHTSMGVGFSGSTVTDFNSAKEAVAAAIAAEASGRYSLVRVWVERHGMVDFPDIGELHKRWA